MHEEGCDHCRSNESYGHSLTELAVPACKSGEYNPPPSVPHMDGKRAAPRKGRRVVFAGIRFLCRAGPMCPAEKCVPGGGARGPRPTGQVRYPPVGDGVPTSHQRGSAALGDGFPRQCVLQGHLLRGAHWLGMTALRAVWADRVVRPYKCLSGIPVRDVEGGVSNGITRRPAGMRLRVAPIRLTTFRDAGMIAVVPSHS